MSEDLKTILADWKPGESNPVRFRAGIGRKIVRRRKIRLASVSVIVATAAVLLFVQNRPPEPELLAANEPVVAEAAELSWWWSSALDYEEPSLPGDYEAISSYLKE